MKTLWIIRGLPGSGKSTLAKALMAACVPYKTRPRHFEADQYFTDPHTGKYLYRKEEIPIAHNWCQQSVKTAMLDGVEDIFVANVFAKQDHVRYYINVAHDFGYAVQVILCQGNFGSIHNVPEASIQRMKEHFEYELTL